MQQLKKRVNRAVGLQMEEAGAPSSAYFGFLRFPLYSAANLVRFGCSVLGLAFATWIFPYSFDSLRAHLDSAIRYIVCGRFGNDGVLQGDDRQWCTGWRYDQYFAERLQDLMTAADMRGMRLLWLGTERYHTRNGVWEVSCSSDSTWRYMRYDECMNFNFSQAFL